MVAQRYGKRPSEIIDPTQTWDDYTRYSIDVAVALRCKVEESNAIKSAYEGEDDTDNDMVDNLRKKETPQERRRREKIASQNEFAVDRGRLVGGISGEIGKYDKALVGEYERLGGFLPKTQERDDRVARLLEERKLAAAQRREEKIRKDAEARARQEAKRLARER